MTNLNEGSFRVPHLHGEYDGQREDRADGEDPSDADGPGRVRVLTVRYRSVDQDREQQHKLKEPNVSKY